jgi:hypothetical protein
MRGPRPPAPLGPMPHLNPLIASSTEMGHREPTTINAFASSYNTECIQGLQGGDYPTPMVLHAPTDVCLKKNRTKQNKVNKTKPNNTKDSDYWFSIQFNTYISSMYIFNKQQVYNSERGRTKPKQIRPNV